MSKQISKEPTEYINNAHLLLMEREGYADLPSELAGAGYEHTFEFSSLRELRKILDDAELKKDLRRRMAKFSFSRTTCIFKQQESFEVPLEDQRRMVDYQDGLFTDVTVTHLEDQTEQLQELIDYASRKGKDVAVFTDLHYDDELLATAYGTIAGNKGVKRVKLYSLRIVGNVGKYRNVSRAFRETDKMLHLTHCQRTISSEAIKHLSYEHLVAIFGFTSFTQNYSETERQRAPGSRFIPMPFDRGTVCYQPGAMKTSYRRQKLVDLGNVAAELQVFIAAIRNGEAEQYVRTKPALRAILAELRISL